MLTHWMRSNRIRRRWDSMGATPSRCWTKPRSSAAGVVTGKVSASPTASSSSSSRVRAQPLATRSRRRVNLRVLRRQQCRGGSRCSLLGPRRFPAPRTKETTMTKLRSRMMQDLDLGGYAKKTKQTHVDSIRDFVRGSAQLEGTDARSTASMTFVTRKRSSACSRSLLAFAGSCTRKSPSTVSITSYATWVATPIESRSPAAASPLSPTRPSPSAPKTVSPPPCTH
jgi:hypothetical protein